jgi:hypothetical protein
VSLHGFLIVLIPFTIMLEIVKKAANIILRRSSGVPYPRSLLGGGAFIIGIIEASAFAGKVERISLN